MSDLFKRTNISKYNKSDPRYLRVSESEISRSKDRDGNPILQYKNKSINSLKLLYARVMQILLEKSSSADSINISHLTAGEKEFYSLLYALYNNFLALSSTDKSTDIKFLNNLSSTWNFLQLSVKRRQTQKHPPTYIDLLNNTMESIENYNQDEGEPLGYYLKGHKKADWFPIPYLQMLSYLHADSIENSTDSFLSVWQENLKLLMVAVAST